MPDDITMQPLAERFEEAAPHFAGAELPWLKALRETGIERYNALGLPTPRVEAWKYTNLRSLGRTGFVPAMLAPDVSLDTVPEARALAIAAPVAVLVNGKFRADLSRLDDLPAGVEVTGLADLLARDPAAIERLLEERLPEETGDNQPMRALNAAFMADGLIVRIAEGAKADRPLHLISVGAAADAPLAFHPRNLIHAGKDSRAILVESHVGAGGVYLGNSVTDAVLGPGAALDHIKLQNEDRASYHLALTGTVLAEGSAYRNFTLSAGARLARNEIHATLEGGGIECRLDGAYMARGTQHLDTTTFIDHAKPGSESRETYKGVLDGQSRGVFQGKILVRRDAQKTDGHQLNKALLLSPEAEIDTKPELEIYADDVKCSHGASTGEIDEEQMFYLQARGIDREDARDLLVAAFLEEAIENIAVTEARDAMRQMVATWLAEGKTR
jgi:Fe-S cluster assembly protein SufD